MTQIRKVTSIIAIRVQQTLRTGNKTSSRYCCQRSASENEYFRLCSYSAAARHGGLEIGEPEVHVVLLVQLYTNDASPSLCSKCSVFCTSVYGVGRLVKLLWGHAAAIPACSGAVLVPPWKAVVRERLVRWLNSSWCYKAPNKCNLR